MDLIPVDYVINATIVLSFYVATHPIQQVEVIHCTSGKLILKYSIKFTF